VIEMPLHEKHRLHVPSRNNETVSGKCLKKLIGKITA